MRETKVVTETEIGLLLERLGQELEPAFSKLVGVYEKNRDLGSKALFISATIKIAESGWRSSEILLIFFDVILKNKNSARLKEICSNVELFSGFSNDPLMAYLGWVRRAFDKSSLELVELVEGTAAEIHRVNPYSSKSLTAYFESMILLIEIKSDQKRIARCLALIKKWSSFDRVYLERLFANFEDAFHSIGLIKALDQKKPIAALQYVERIEKINERPFKKSKVFDDLLVRFASEEIADVLETLIDMPSYLTDNSPTLFKLGAQLRTKESLIAFFEASKTLPLDRPDILDDWLDQGLKDPSINDAALKAYVGLESLKSRKALESLLGEVSLAANRQTLDLLAKAISSGNVLISEIEEDSDEYNLFIKTGEDQKLCLYLPEKVSAFGSHKENFSFYKVSLFHQIGFREFGCVSEIAEIVSQISIFTDNNLARFIFMALESARIDWRLKEKYPGLSKQIDNQRKFELLSRTRIDLARNTDFLELINQVSLGLPRSSIANSSFVTEVDDLYGCFKLLKPSMASVGTTLKALKLVYELLLRIEIRSKLRKSNEGPVQERKYPEPVKYRGQISIAMLEKEGKSKIVDMELPDLDDPFLEGDPIINASASGNDRVELGELKQGALESGASAYIEESANVQHTGKASLGLTEAEDFKTGFRKNREVKREKVFHYDEWDFEIKDYRPSWCTLRESVRLERDLPYFTRVIENNTGIISKIRQELSRIRPQNLRRVKGVRDGEDLNIERTVSYFIDKKVGVVPDEAIYEQRQRVERDVATLFLVDMSASTDDIIETPGENSNSEKGGSLPSANGKRIIDVEKEAVSLLSEVLDELGDAYSICGFSGYGREQIDYYRCKGFDKPMNDDSRAKLGGLKPCRSTRMGPSIRHAIRELVATGSRTKSLIIISDGYPQDHDYGPDRSSKTYGLMDTMKALSEARAQDISSFCLTVDPSGNDYLRDMCPENQYMVIKNVSDLPGELSRVYLSLTG